MRIVAAVAVAAAASLSPVGGSGGAYAVQDGAAPSWFTEGPVYVTGPTYFADRKIASVTQSIPQLKDLGLRTVYLLPVWKHVGQYPYSILDYYATDPRYGETSDLRAFVKAVHDSGMRIIFDLVTGYTPDSGVIATKHPDWLLRSRKGEIEQGWPHHWGPTVDRANPQVQDYFVAVARHYVEHYGIDGWRADAPQNNYNPKEVPGQHDALDIFRKIRRAVAGAKPDAVLYGEWHGIRNDWGEFSDRHGTEFDEVFDCSQGWLFRRWALDAARRGGTNSQDLIEFLRNEPVGCHRLRSRFLEDQNVQRIPVVLKEHLGGVGLLRPLAVLTFTVPGVPYMQAGQEIGALAGRERSNPFPATDWSAGDASLREFYKKLIAIHRRCAALRCGSIANVWKSGDNAYGYGRSHEAEKTIVVLNFAGKPATPNLDLSFLHKGARLRDEFSQENLSLDNPGAFRLDVPAFGFWILTVTAR